MAQNRHALEPPVFPSGDLSLIKIRAALVPTTSPVVAKTHDSVNAGWFNVKGCDFINIYVKFVDGSGNVTDIILFADFTDESKSTIYNSVVHDFATGVGLGQLIKAQYQFLTAGNYVFSIPNPGAAWSRISIEANGTMTNGLVTIDIMRSFGSVLQPSIPV